ncbi:hypothetical protein GF318_04915 [Candidatus Micrarchaeota archaeon]|nr:hypothetical protein [Candidatus Micrarchaeota archaeon]
MVNAGRPSVNIEMKTGSFKLNGKKKHFGVLFNKGTVPLLEVPGRLRLFNNAYRTSLQLVDPRTADYLCNSGQLSRLDSAEDYLVTNVCIAYSKPGRKLESEIVYLPEHHLPVVVPTGPYKGEKDICLAIPDISPDEIARSKRELVVDVPGERLVPVSGFPAKSGWYLPHETTFAPHGLNLNMLFSRKKSVVEGPSFPECIEVPAGEDRNLLKTTQKARYYHISPSPPYAGMLVRATHGHGDFSIEKSFFAERHPTRMYGVAVLVPEEDLELITEPSGPDSHTPVPQALYDAEESILTVADVLGIPRRELRGKVSAARGSLERMSSIIGTELIDPIREVLEILERGET